MTRNFIFVCLLLILLFNVRSIFAQPDGILMSHDTLNYLCSFDNLLDGVGRSKIFKPNDAEFVKLIANVELGVRPANYMTVYEAGFIRTAGVTWRNNHQIFLYNPEKIKRLRQRFTDKDSLAMLFRGIILHELGHHLMPHSVISLDRKKTLKKDSIKIFERQADNYMGQILRRNYHVQAYEAKFIIRELIDENDEVQQFFSKKERIENVIAGWRMGGEPLASKSPMYNSFLKLQDDSDASASYYYGQMHAKCFKCGPIPNDSIKTISDVTAEFKIVTQNGFEYLSMKLPPKRLHRNPMFQIVGTVVEFSNDLFPRIAYDQYFVTWYISKQGEVFNVVDGEFIYLGKIE